MIELLLGYFFMGLLFLVVRFFYHLLPKKIFNENFIHAVKNDCLNLYIYVKQLILSNSKIFKVIPGIIAGWCILLPLLKIPIDIKDVISDALLAMIFFLLVKVFVPPEKPSSQGFPVEIFGFIYSIIFTFYHAGLSIVDVSFIFPAFEKEMWFYGYIVTVISYVLCTATLRRFMERNLSREGIIILGMTMLTTLKFITYYGIGFFGGLQWYKPAVFDEEAIFGDITSIINQGIFIASQSQILERSAMEIWGYIILNGTDVLTITVVLGYLLQKFMDM